MAISVKFPPFIRQWAHLFLPYQSLAHFRTIFDFLTELILYRSVTAQRKVYSLYVILAMYCLQKVYFWAFLPPPMDRLRRGDFVALVFQTDTFYLVTVTLDLMTLYYTDVLCFTMKPSFLRLLEDTLFRDTHRTLTGVAYGRLSEQTTARLIILVLVNLLHGFMLVIDSILLFLIYSLITTAIESPGELLGSPLDTPLTFSWNVICMILGTWTMGTGLTLYGKICINIGAVGAGQVCLLFRRLYHSETLLEVYSRKDRLFFSWAPFLQYLVYSGQTFGIIFTVNPIFGRLFFAFLLANMPISAWAIVQIALGKLSQWSSIALAFMPAHELIGCILLHLSVAKFTKRLHAPSKVLLSLNASTGHRVGNFRACLLLHHTIVRLHTNSQYGITYGSVGGLITFGSFGKCMLLYIKLLMYSYKLIRYN